MKTYKHYIQRINYYLFFVLAISLPFPRPMVQWCWIIWAISWLLELRFLDRQNLQWGKRMMPALFLFGWAIWECLTPMWAEGARFPDPHLSLLFFPLIYLYGVNELYDWKKISRVYIASCALSICLYAWVLYWVQNHDYVLVTDGNGDKLPLTPDLFYAPLSTIKHCMLYCTSLGIAVILLLMQRKELVEDWGKVKGWAFFGGCLTLLLGTILLTGSRANLLTLILLGGVALFRKIRKHRMAYMVVIAAITCMGILGMWKFHPRMKNFTTDQITHLKDHYHDPDMQPRLIIWDLALEHPKDYLATGLGAGNAKPYLAEKYREADVLWMIVEGFGPHNQYLQVCMELGVVAMVFFVLLWFGIPLSYRRGSTAQSFALYFTLFLGINMMTDDNLSRIEGVIYTCFCLLVAHMMLNGQETRQIQNK